MLKYQNIARVGDRIRAYDFAGLGPKSGRNDCYIEGIVERIDREGYENGFAAFVIVVDKDVWPERPPRVEGNTTTLHKKQGRVGCTTYVPMEVAFFEYDGRIVNLSCTD